MSEEWSEKMSEEGSEEWSEKGSEEFSEEWSGKRRRVRSKVRR